MMILFQTKTWKLICANNAQFAGVVKLAYTADERCPVTLKARAALVSSTIKICCRKAYRFESGHRHYLLSREQPSGWILRIPCYYCERTHAQAFACVPWPRKVAHYILKAQTATMRRLQIFIESLVLRSISPTAEAMRLERIEYGFKSHVEYHNPRKSSDCIAGARGFL